MGGNRIIKKHKNLGKKKGKVKFITKSNKGHHYGFIIPDERNSDVYFRGSDVDGWIEKGDNVEYDLIETRKIRFHSDGLEEILESNIRAKNVRKITLSEKILSYFLIGLIFLGLLIISYLFHFIIILI